MLLRPRWETMSPDSISASVQDAYMVPYPALGPMNNIYLSLHTAQLPVRDVYGILREPPPRGPTLDGVPIDDYNRGVKTAEYMPKVECHTASETTYTEYARKQTRKTKRKSESLGPLHSKNMTFSSKERHSSPRGHFRVTYICSQCKRIGQLSFQCGNCGCQDMRPALTEKST